ncbi:helix-turn-helix transcriptional regulator [Nonomuraea sp. NPDC049725]|uniref:helix-turn-helix domain-containing protein n=1 Tax=Nonomuraea sp. NPDC049725 TaxID=3154508 RepID=UPI00341F8E35
MRQTDGFGPTLHRLRIAEGLTLSQLARQVHYSKGYLSKIEHGLKQPSIELARQCDILLNANGALTALTTPPTIETKDSSWQVSCRQTLGAEASSLFSNTSNHVDPAMLTFFQSSLQNLRLLGQTAPPDLVLPLIITQTNTLREITQQVSEPARVKLLSLCARFAEYAGWMAQELGDDRAALWWTGQAVDLAAAGQDHEVESYALVRRALVAFYRGDAAQTITLAHRALTSDTTRRIRGLAGLREAQGHALAGDHYACSRALDRARDLLAIDDGSKPMLGSANLPDSVAMVTGWCLYDLGRPREAAEVLDVQCGRLRAHAWRNQARYGIRRARAHAANGEIEHACALTQGLLDPLNSVQSATVRTDLRRLIRTLCRFRTNSSVRALYPSLIASIY